MRKDYRQSEGEPIKPTYIRLSEHLHKHLRSRAAKTGVHLSTLTIQAIKNTYPKD